MFDDLAAFDLADVPAFYADAAQTATDAAVTLAGDYRFSRQTTRRTLLDLTRVANAAKHLERLPERDESIHCIMRGNYNGWDLVPAILQLAAPARCLELLIATLGFNGRNAAELLDLLDAGDIKAVSFLCSSYFRGACTEEFNRLVEGLTQRGQRVLAARTHAKIIAMHLDDGRHVMIESSANLRSCRNIEQFTMTESPDLYAFHRRWMDEVFARGEQR